MTASNASDLIASARTFVDDFNTSYEAKHVAFENQFWGTKMALSSTESATYSTELLSETKAAMEDLLSDPQVLQKARDHQKALAGLQEDFEDLNKVLSVIVRTCECNEFPTPETKAVRVETNRLEGELEQARNQMEGLGYTNAEGTFVAASSVGLRTVLRTNPDEGVRKSAYQGLKSIGTFVLDHGFLEIVKLRNQLARLLGYCDYYDYTVTNAEGFSKATLFGILDGLETGTRPLMEKAREQLKQVHGESALEPWNTSYMLAGSVVAKMDPYFPFGKAVERYVRSYAALGIGYSDATMTLDLLDRKHKYSNGFCHWPVPAWTKPDGTWCPSQTNFTSLADPAAVGSGLTALTTLMHEAGHAAHFANIRQPSPLFSQERAPTSVAYAENQSMFLDSLVGDAAWRAKYARNAADEPIPFEILEEGIRSTHPFKVFQLRSMLSVSYFEKALYELDDADLTPETVQALADATETKIQGGLGPRPLLSIPHLVSDEASCYYQGYTLAEMSVHQTREYFQKKYGYIVDNPHVGPTLKSAYWECGNSKPFLEIVKDLTGSDLKGDAWIAELQTDLEEHIQQEQKEYTEMIEKCRAEELRDEEEKKDGDKDLDLQMTVRFVDGDTVIADSSVSGLLGSCREFEAFVEARVAQAKAEASDKIE